MSRVRISPGLNDFFVFWEGEEGKGEKWRGGRKGGWVLGIGLLEYC